MKRTIHLINVLHLLYVDALSDVHANIYAAKAKEHIIETRIATKHVCCGEETLLSSMPISTCTSIVSLSSSPEFNVLFGSSLDDCNSSFEDLGSLLDSSISGTKKGKVPSGTIVGVGEGSVVSSANA